MRNISKLAIAFARTAADTNASEAERATATAKLAEYCTANGCTIADVQAAVEADSLTASEKLKRAMRSTTSDAATAAHKAANASTAKRAKAEPKPEPKPTASKPEKPSKPADDSKAAAYAERVKLIDSLREAVSTLYNGPSLAIRSNPKRFPLAAYADLLAAPKHRTTLDRLSVRDESGIREALRASKRGIFDPSAINLDLGIFSRLASVGFIEAADGGFSLTKAGADHARIVVKRAA